MSLPEKVVARLAFGIACLTLSGFDWGVRNQVGYLSCFSSTHSHATPPFSHVKIITTN
jgi:hypothetical protein